MTDEKITYPSGATRSADSEGTRFDLIPVWPLWRLAERYALGAAKHGDRNWEKGQPVSAVVNHLLRHLFCWLRGDRDDDHLAAAAWGIFCLMYNEREFPTGCDDVWDYPGTFPDKAMTKEE